MNTHFKLLVVLALVVFTFSSCNKIEGEGPIVSEDLDIDYFTGLSNNTSSKVTVKYGADFKVIATGEANIIDRIRTYVDNGVWNFELEDGNYRSYSLSVEVTMPELDFIQLNGSGNVVLSGVRPTEDATVLSIKLNGSGKLQANELRDYTSIYCKSKGSGSTELSDIVMVGSELTLESSGSGGVKILDSEIIADKLNVKLEGSGGISIASSEASSFMEATVNSSGSGSINLVECITRKWSSTQNGSGSVKAYVMDEMSVVLNGSGSFGYKGSPTITKLEINGSGGVKQL